MKHLEKEFSQSCSLKRPSCSAASGIKNAFKNALLNPEIKFLMKHLQKEFSRSCVYSLRRLSWSVASYYFGVKYLN